MSEEKPLLEKTFYVEDWEESYVHVDEENNNLLLKSDVESAVRELKEKIKSTCIECDVKALMPYQINNIIDEVFGKVDRK